MSAIEGSQCHRPQWPNPVGALGQSRLSGFLSVPMSVLVCTADEMDRNVDIGIDRRIDVRHNIFDRLLDIE